MLRLAGYVLAVFALLILLRQVPVVGRLFDIPFVGFFLAAALLSAGVGWWTARTVESAAVRRQVRQFGAVDTPHNHGKLGVLLLAKGRARAALPHLAQAAEGEPERAEWHHRLGQARLAVGDARGAVDALERCVATDPDHAFGAPLLRLAEAQRAARDPAGALESVGRFERERGETAESAFQRGLALRSAGRRDEARAAFRSVGRLAGQALRGARQALVPLRIRAWFLGRV